MSAALLSRSHEFVAMNALLAFLLLVGSEYTFTSLNVPKSDTKYSARGSAFQFQYTAELKSISPRYVSRRSCYMCNFPGQGTADHLHESSRGLRLLKKYQKTRGHWLQRLDEEEDIQHEASHAASSPTTNVGDDEGWMTIYEKRAHQLSMSNFPLHRFHR